MTSDPSTTAFGLVVVGDEVLNGGRSDQHLGRFKGMLAARGHELAWHWVLPDEPRVLVEHLGFSMSRSDPVFVCGGIGATPDDHTRPCAALAAGLALERHPEAQALIEGRFGADAYPSRILMADLPAGCELIPNPYNQIPGFALKAHFFLPGFPEMAWPMAESVLDRLYPAGPISRERSLIVRGAPESRLVPLMQRLIERFPGVKFFSLPHLGDDPHILVGVRGRTGVDGAFCALCAELEGEEVGYEAQDAGA